MLSEGPVFKTFTGFDAISIFLCFCSLASTSQPSHLVKIFNLHSMLQKYSACMQRSRTAPAVPPHLQLPPVPYKLMELCLCTQLARCPEARRWGPDSHKILILTRSTECTHNQVLKRICVVTNSEIHVPLKM